MASTFNGRKIYLAMGAADVEYELPEWRLCESPVNCIIHVPTWSIFQIERDRDQRNGRAVTPGAFFARIVHLCDPEYRPSDEELEFLGRAAVVVYLQAVGIWTPDMADGADRPERKLINSRHPKPN